MAKARCDYDQGILVAFRGELTMRLWFHWPEMLWTCDIYRADGRQIVGKENWSAGTNPVQVKTEAIALLELAVEYMDCEEY